MLATPASSEAPLTYKCPITRKGNLSELLDKIIKTGTKQP